VLNLYLIFFTSIHIALNPCLIGLNLCLIMLILDPIRPILCRIYPSVHFSTLSSCPSGMSHPPMVTSSPSLSFHNAEKCSFTQAKGHSWLICRATMMVYLCNSPLDLMEKWSAWGLSSFLSLRNPFPQPQRFQELGIYGLSTTNFHNRAITRFLNLNFKISLELRDTPRS
jgi:hypothetical protein